MTFEPQHMQLALTSPLATADDALELRNCAREWGIGEVCVPPHLLSALGESELRVVALCGHPSGAHHPLIKATEARFAVQQGAAAINLVPDLGAVAASDANSLLGEIVAVREAITEHIGLIVDLSTVELSEEQLALAAENAARAGAGFIKVRPSGLPVAQKYAPAVVLCEDAAEAEVVLGAGANRIAVSSAVLRSLVAAH